MSYISRLLPAWAKDKVRAWRGRAADSRNAGRSAAEVFSDVYDRNLWGKETDFYSGPGSDPVVAAPYISAVGELIRRNKISSVVDVGCGDFQIGAAIAAMVPHYVGVDVASNVIARNQKQFGNGRIAFVALDAAEDDLPDGELCLVRQVLQHLSNEQVRRILAKLGKYRFVVISDGRFSTADQPANVNKAHGPLSRQAIGSYIALDQPPFDLRGLTLLAEIAVPAFDHRGVETVRSYLLMPNPPASAGSR